jgi:HEAT repeat protein
MKETTPSQSQTQPRPSRIPLFALISLVIAIGLGALVYSSHHPEKNLPAAASASAPEVPALTENATPAGTSLPPTISPTALAVKASTKTNEVAATASLDDLIKILKDPAQPIKARIKAARALLENGSNEAMVAIKEVLRDGPAALRASIAEDLGSCANPESYSLMYGLLSDSDESVAMGAVRGLAREGSVQAANALSQKLYDPTVPLNVRCEAALGLGSVNQPGTLNTLTRAATTIADEDIVTQVLNALGNRPFDEIKSFFEDYLKSPNVSNDLKVAAIEALGNSQNDPSALLLGYAGNPDGELRASAAWALSNTDTPGKAQDQILAWLKAEADPSVRLRLFQALGNQENFDVASVQALLGNESNPGARTAGFDLLAQQLRENPSPDLAAYFDVNAVPALRAAAFDSLTASDRMSAVIALKRAGTPAAIAALKQLAQSATDPRVRSSATITANRNGG